ncbi:styrene monooxygenase/indole monooxygenase family protein [Streptomyces eurocidicus]|uniref:Glycine/D-amino acid oxidase-like deaminating enzyme n=1 Tax=Streptomyces eurocidicus TaxID=66423 RepID=A0A7W8BF55_STREU|nr:styrene monooxygenase/indole monooxygenase family protein [Streptomyces eurocidicus]MBB5122244.1 glycine/D-amino acid oxidase-like deaminating enzyme [Streptomyces eurocidicus]MBF6055129.1 monooxygenase [Streptomyces eurocidicus]
MRIAIIGDGISGLHLALRLRQLGIDVTLFGAKSPEAVRHGRALNFVARSGSTRRREELLGLDLWASPDTLAEARTVTVHGPEPLTFRADPDPAYSMVDFRLYLPAVVEEYLARGGRHIVTDLTARTAHEAAADHDLVVVAGGRAAGELFPRDPGRSPFDAPQRVLCGGLYRGIGETVPHSIEFHVVPGVGEVLRMPFHCAEGRVDVLGLEAVPGGPLDPLCRTPYAEDPAHFHSVVLDVLHRYVPDLRERVDERAFGLNRPADLVQGGVVPVVRRAWRALTGTTYALAVGDAWIVNDPITAQGANLGSHCALELAEAIAAGPPYDEAFCRAAEERMWPYAESVVQWTAAFVRPPSPQLLSLFRAADADPAVAAAFAVNFDDPPAMWRSIASPERTAAFLAEVRSGATPPEGSAVSSTPDSASAAAGTSRTQPWADLTARPS